MITLTDANYPINASNNPTAPYNQIPSNDDLADHKYSTIEWLQQTLGDALPDILITGITGEHKITLTDNGHYDYTALNYYDQKRSHAIENGDAKELGRLSYEAAIEYAIACAKYHNQTFDQIFND